MSTVQQMFSNPFGQPTRARGTAEYPFNGGTCKVCKGKLYQTKYEVMDAGGSIESRFTIACDKCGKVITDTDDFTYFKYLVGKLWESTEHSTTKQTGKSKSLMTMSQAYELNKTRQRCAACGQDTKPNYVLTPYIMYCECVERLPKE